MAALQDTIFKVEIRSEAQTRHELIQNSGLSEQILSNILKADILILPTPVGRGRDEQAFPSGTDNLYLDLIEKYGSSTFALFVDPGDYRELDLHSDKLRLPRLFVPEDKKAFVLGVLASLVAGLILEAKAPTSVELSVIFEPASRQCVEISYVGPPEEIEATLKHYFDKCSDGNGDKDAHKSTDSEKQPRKTPIAKSIDATPGTPPQMPRRPKPVGRVSDD